MAVAVVAQFDLQAGCRGRRVDPPAVPVAGCVFARDVERQGRPFGNFRVEENADIQSDVASVGVAVEVRPGLFVVDSLLRAAVPECGAVVDRKGGHGPENLLLPLDVDVVRDLRRKRFRERFVPALLAAQGIGFGREIFGLRGPRAALAAASEPDGGRYVGRVAPAQGIVRLGVGLFRGGRLRVERDAFSLPDVVLRVGGFETPVAPFGVAVKASGLGMADFMPTRVVPFEARAERALQIPAQDVTALRLGFDVHHLLFFGRVVPQALCLGAEILVDPHAPDVRGFEVGECVGGFRAEEVFPVDQHPFDLLPFGVNLVVLDLDTRQLLQQLRETVVGHGFERPAL